MSKLIRRILIILLAIVFVGSVAYVGLMLYRYNQSSESYEEAIEKFVISHNEVQEVVSGDLPSVSEEGEAPRRVELAPLVIDFEALQAVGPDVVGWLYCEGTVINYPVLHGADNDMYLHHLYDGSYTYSGSIFVEASNRKYFQDANTIIYGHNMKDGSMFGILDNWQNQAFYEEHPTFWLITPEQDYRVELFSGYTTSAYSDTYTIFSGGGAELDEYLASAVAQSAFTAAVQPEKDVNNVLLSTCAYIFDDARFVLHGKLVPVDSAGGLLKIEQ